jgi:hypothetical protein
MQELLIYAAFIWATTGMVSDMAARHCAWKKGIRIPGDILFAIMLGPISGLLVVKFVRGELR